MTDLKTATGYVIIATRGPDGPGEIEIPDLGKYVAWSREALPVGAEVMVTSTRGTRTVTVQPTGL